MKLFERVNAVEQILRRDPSDAYASMDFESRDTTAKRLPNLAKRAERQRARSGAESNRIGASDPRFTATCA